MTTVKEIVWTKKRFFDILDGLYGYPVKGNLVDIEYGDSRERFIVIKVKVND